MESTKTDTILPEVENNGKKLESPPADIRDECPSPKDLKHIKELTTNIAAVGRRPAARLSAGQRRFPASAGLPRSPTRGRPRGCATSRCTSRTCNWSATGTWPGRGCSRSPPAAHFFCDDPDPAVQDGPGIARRVHLHAGLLPAGRLCAVSVRSDPAERSRRPVRGGRMGRRLFPRFHSRCGTGSALQPPAVRRRFAFLGLLHVSRHGELVDKTPPLGRECDWPAPRRRASEALRESSRRCLHISSQPMPRVVKAGVPMRMPEGSIGLRWSKGIMFLLTVMPQRSSACSAWRPVVPSAVTSARIRWLSVPPLTSFSAAGQEHFGQGLGVVDDLPDVLLEGRREGLAEADGLAGDDVHQRPALDARETRPCRSPWRRLPCRG